MATNHHTADTTDATPGAHGADERDVVLEVRNANVTFDMERGESRVLNDVNIDIHRQEILGVVGESGSGKSMLASSLLNAVVDPGVLSGSVTYYPKDGDPVDVLSLSQSDLRELRWQEISFVVQAAQSAFNPTMKVSTHFVETLSHHGEDIDAGLERARDLLEDLYLEPDRVFDSYPHELSGGMKQRALIALSLVLEPEVLVLDEPTAALDLLMQRSITSLLHNLQEKYDLTMVFVTHDMPVVSDIATRIAVMYAFQVIEAGPTDEMLSNASHPYTRALLNSVPDIRAPADETKSIPGSSPDPVNVPAGCSYNPRCPLATEECEQEHPPFYDVDDATGESHTVACYHWERATEEISIPLGDEGGDREQ